MTKSLNIAPSKMHLRELAIIDILFPEKTEEINSTRELLNTIFSRFDITNDFNFNQEFLSNLQYILKIGLTHNTHTNWNKSEDYQLSNSWPNWLKATSEALDRYIAKYGKTENLKLPSKGTGSKPADCILKNLHEDATENQIGLILLYVAFIMLPTERSEPFNSKEITRSFTNAVTLDTVFEQTPLDIRHTPSEEFLENISVFSQKLISTGRYGRKYNDFLRRLDDISRLFMTGHYKHQHKNQPNSTHTSTSSNNSKRHKPPVHRFTRFHELPQTEEYTPPGVYQTLIGDSSEEPVHGIVDSNNDDPERQQIPKESRDAELRIGSKYWIQNFAEYTPWSLNGINPFTRKVLIEWLDKNDSYESLILHLMLSIGLKISGILNLSIGRNQDISREGQYRRTYTPPKQHYSPNESDKGLLVPTDETFILQLPDFVISLLKKHVEENTDYPTLADALNISVEETESNISEIIKQLIKQGATGLARDRIHLSLRKQISIMTGDDFLSYVITGIDKEAPPVSSYYSNISVSLIQEVYDQAIKELYA